ncbi:MAG: hypothetical protein JO202_17330, partial [Ktedonobacteraceae bacterium]|nr:hypothetical protein [Ktedonobacteraceae bacterium]
MGLWDSNFKQLVNANPQAFADWLLPGARVIRELSEHLTRTLDVDSLYETVEGAIARGKNVSIFVPQERRCTTFQTKSMLYSTEEKGGSYADVR